MVFLIKMINQVEENHGRNGSFLKVLFVYLCGISYACYRFVWSLFISVKSVCKISCLNDSKRFVPDQLTKSPRARTVQHSFYAWPYQWSIDYGKTIQEKLICTFKTYTVYHIQYMIYCI